MQVMCELNIFICIFSSFHFGNLSDVRACIVTGFTGELETDSAVVYMPWRSVQVEKYSSFNVIMFIVIVLSMSAW